MSPNVTARTDGARVTALTASGLSDTSGCAGMTSRDVHARSGVRGRLYCAQQIGRTQEEHYGRR